MKTSLQRQRVTLVLQTLHLSVQVCPNSTCQLYHLDGHRLLLMLYFNEQKHTERDGYLHYIEMADSKSSLMIAIQTNLFI